MISKLKSIAAPKTWALKRKKNVWTMKPKGGHKLAYSLPVSTLLKLYLKHAKTTKEVKDIINHKTILVDGVKINKINHGIGVMDIFEIPELKEKHIILINKRGKLYPAKTDLNFKISKIIGKTKRGKKTQINLFGGKNILVDKDIYKVGDSLLIEIKDFKIKDHIKFEDGAFCFLLAGSHIGETGRIKKIEEDRIIISGEDGNEFETLKKFIYIIGKEKPLVKIEK